MDWLNNPTQFEYKLSENSERKIKTITDVKVFEIVNKSKYVRQNIGIDRSTNVIAEMGYNKNPVFNKEQLFLKVLIEGKANLYLYEDKGLIRYFFNEGLTEVKQLIFKNYLVNSQQVAKNYEFRRQLWNTLKCEGIPMERLTKINYRQSELIKFFIEYNKCSNSDFVNYQIKQKKDMFNLTIRPGIRSSSQTIGNDLFSWKEIDFGSGITSFRLGLEAEFILGFNNNKWTLLLEPTYQQFESDATIISNQSTGEELFATVNYESVQINFGVRYYFLFKNNLKLFANALALYDTSFNSSVEVNGSIASVPVFSSDINSQMGVALGIGCKYKNRYNAELRYLPKRNLLNGAGAWGSELSSVSLILGYTLF